MAKEEKQEHKSRNFNLYPIIEQSPLIEYGKIKVGNRTIEDAVVRLGPLKKINPQMGDKYYVLDAIHNGNIQQMREISEWFFRVSGIYSRLCRYMAFLYRYDWLVTPYVNQEDSDIAKITTKFYKGLTLLDNFGVKEFCGDVALKVMRRGCYYGYIVRGTDSVMVQELPPNYCRVRYFVKESRLPAVEFNMKFFDEQFRDATLRQRVLKLFPKEFAKGYHLYKKGKLRDELGMGNGWYLLEVGSAIKFNLNDEDYPALISVIPAIIDLDDAQGIDQQKAAQRLMKIIIQKLPLNKEGEMIFDPDEARDIHNNAVRMLGRAIGVDVLTTFADVDVADTDSTGAQTATDELERRERTVYNEAGISQMQFNTDGNIALEKSILNDEATMLNLVLQFEKFLNVLLKPYNKTPKKIDLRAQVLPTTIYNYKEMAKQYKELTSLGYSKMLPMIAMGQTQSAILATAYFENQVLQLYNILIPPLSTNVMNGDTLLNLGQGGDPTGKTQQQEKQNPAEEKKEAGRPELEDDQKSEKTIKNKESQS